MLFLRGFDPYSRVYSLISDLILYLVSLELILTRDKMCIQRPHEIILSSYLMKRFMRSLKTHNRRLNKIYNSELTIIRI